MKVLIIGLGSIGRKHVDALKIIDSSIEIFALRSQNTTDVYSNVINVYSLSQVHDFSFVIVSNPTSEHKKTIETLIVHNVPLFIEKPLFSDLDNVNLLNEIKIKNLLTYVACNLRFLDCINYVKNYLTKKANKLNEVNVYCGSYLPAWRPNVDYRNTYSSKAELGGGVHIDLIHELDYLYWFFGVPIDINRTFKSQSTLKISSIDFANYVLNYDGFCSNVVLNYYRRDAKRTLELVFENETWLIDLLNNSIVCNEKVIFSSKQKIVETYLLQLQYFIKCVNEKRQTFNTVENAYEVLRICIEK